MTRKLLIGVLGVLLCFNGFAFAQEPKFPTKPIRMVVGYAPGGGQRHHGQADCPADYRGDGSANHHRKPGRGRPRTLPRSLSPNHRPTAIRCS